MTAPAPSPAAAPASTRLLAKEAGLQLLRAGQRPTAERIRQLIGQGAQQTILSALDDLWLEVGERLNDPRLPSALLAPVTALWSAAVSEAGAQWAQARAALEAQRESAAAEIAQLRAAVAAGEQARQAWVARGEEQARLLAGVRAELAAAQQAQVALNEALAAQGAATATAEQALQDLGERFDLEQTRAARALDQERQAHRQTVAARDQLAGEARDLREQKHALEVKRSGLEQQVTGLEAQLQCRVADWQQALETIERLQADARQAVGAAQAALQRCQEQQAAEETARRAEVQRMRQERADLEARATAAHQELAAELAGQRLELAVLTVDREQAARERDEARAQVIRAEEEAQRLQATVLQLALRAADAATREGGNPPGMV